MPSYELIALMRKAYNEIDEEINDHFTTEEREAMCVKAAEDHFKSGWLASGAKAVTSGIWKSASWIKSTTVYYTSRKTNWTSHD